MPKPTFVVEGRHFPTLVLACAFAQRLAEECERGVEVEKRTMKVEPFNEWVATIYNEKNSPRRNFVAPAERVA